MPCVARPDFFEARLDPVASFKWDVRILPSEDVQQFAFDFAGAFQRAVFYAFSEASVWMSVA